MKQERKKALGNSLKPMTQEDIDKGIAEAEEDIKNGRVYSTEEAKALALKRLREKL